jgi:mRNA interferase RelE/StbE
VYRILISKSAEKDLKRLTSSVFKRIVPKIDKLADNPKPSGCKKLKGSNQNLWRIRIGDYRVIYSIEEEIKVIDIRRVRHRRDVYEQ